MTAKLSTIEPTKEHQNFMNDLKGVLLRYKEKLAAAELLALCSQLVGAIIALQDREKVDVDMAFRIVEANIEHGNQEMISMVLGETKGNA